MLVELVKMVSKIEETQLRMLENQVDNGGGGAWEYLCLVRKLKVRRSEGSKAVKQRERRARFREDRFHSHSYLGLGSEGPYPV